MALLWSAPALGGGRRRTYTSAEGKGLVVQVELLGGNVLAVSAASSTTATMEFCETLLLL
jgi:hypothetical protein